MQQYKYAWHSILKQYSRGYLILIFLLVGFIFIPVLILDKYFSLKFDPAQFVNLYLSTLFTSIFIALTLQFLELFRINIINVKKVNLLCDLILSTLEKLSLELSNDQPHLLKHNSDILQHYRATILNSLSSHEVINTSLITLYNKNEFLYIKESLKSTSNFSESEKTKLLIQINSLKDEIGKLKNNL